jgi:two-component system, OmpR family, phosphate regulon sensor histidine kinase PhoR
MRKRLFAFFMLILFFGVTITGLVSYNFMKKWIVDNTENSLKSESALIEEYTKLSNRNIDLDKLSREIKRIIGRRVTIIDTKGKVVGESDLSKEKLQNHLYRPEIQQALKDGTGNAVRISDTEKLPFYYYAKKVNINGTNYIIRLAIQLNAINDLQTQYFKLIVFAIFVGILISSILAFLYLNHFVKPINTLTNMAAAMSQGHYEKKVLVTSKDEIGQLGNAFNMLSDKLQSTISDLADRQNKLISILTSMDDGVIVLDDSEKIILINPAAKKLFDIERDVIGKYLVETIRNPDFEDIVTNIPSEDVEISIKYPTNRNLRIRTTRVISHDKVNESSLILLVIQDITKIKSLEHMRTEFVANVSHELKTPLTSIKGFAETLKMVEDKETKDKFLDIIYVESERLTRLINDILILSEIESREFSANIEKIDVDLCIKDITHIMELSAIAKSISLNYINIENNRSLFINGDNDKFKQMIINLIDNGIKYTNTGGKVEIRISSISNEVKIEIQDNGIGISEEHIARLFERFYRVDKARSRSVGGTGLGLAIVKHIVILLNGRIQIDSKIGEGTKFTIFLPRA